MSAIRQRARNVLLGVLAGDAAALGLHWVYDQSACNHPVPEFFSPANNRWHSQKSVGDFTHYGDYLMTVLKTAVEQGTPAITAEPLYNNIKARFGPGYNDYMEDWIAGIMEGKGPTSTDTEATVWLSAPMAAVGNWNKPEAEFVEEVQRVVQLTHTNPDSVPYAVGAALAIRHAVVEGGDVQSALACVARAGAQQQQALSLASSRAAESPIAFAASVGLACPTTMAFPGGLQLGLHHGADFPALLRSTILSGGNSTARLWVGGSVAAALSTVPEGLLGQVKDSEAVLALVDRFLDVAQLPQ